MSSPTIAPRLRPPMTIVHGGRGLLLLAAGAAAAADHSLQAAIIVASAGVFGVVIGPFAARWARRHPANPPVDHHVEFAAEQAALIEHLIAEVTELRAELKDQDNEIRRLRRRGT